jgi:quaternary ammonium compound-resistance protein SugE
MAWIVLLVAGLLEVCWAVGLKLSQGFTRPGWALFTLVTLAGSMLLLARALRTLPVGTAYAVWTGIGAVGTAVLGMVIFGESRAPLRLLFLALVVAGILGLKIVSGER